MGWNGTSVVQVKVTINAGVVVGASSRLTAALRTDGASALPAGSRVTIMNRGRIQGAGGPGGQGGGQQTVCHPDRNGFAGGTALLLGVATTIDNLNGQIWGGGGGGAGVCNDCGTNNGGNGGGGGAGTIGGAGGYGGGGSVPGPATPGTATSGGAGQSAGCGGTGGTGGGPGLPGATTGTATGGAAGASVKGSGFANFTSPGDVLGPQVP